MSTSLKTSGTAGKGSLPSHATPCTAPATPPSHVDAPEPPTASPQAGQTALQKLEAPETLATRICPAPVSLGRRLRCLTVGIFLGEGILCTAMAWSLSGPLTGIRLRQPVLWMVGILLIGWFILATVLFRQHPSDYRSGKKAEAEFRREIAERKLRLL